MKTKKKKSNKIRILIIGNQDFINNLKQSKFISSLNNYSIQTISDIKNVLDRLSHNSYDILLLQDKFSTYSSIYLSTLAYAMCRPTMVVCNSYFTILKYFIWKVFSNFSRKYKISRKLIHFIHSNSNHAQKLIYLAENHLQYFKKINKEISKNTKF